MHLLSRAMKISRAAVLGAGTMGTQIAAHLANAGVSVTLFDLTAETAEAAIGALAGHRPPPLFRDSLARQIVPAALGNFQALQAADWVIEAVVEDREIKSDLLAKVAPHLRPDAILSTNTSGIPVALVGAGLGAEVRARWLGTHFFNPPRYLHLVEIIPTPETDPARVSGLQAFFDHRLGKGVVVAKDTPGFIANRLGVFSAIRALEAMAAQGLGVEDVDALTGPLIGRPKSATFRTMDLAGLDVVHRVADDLAARLEANGHDYVAPPLLGALVRAGHLGVKAGHGFYRRARGPERAIETIDPASLDYRPSRPASIKGLDAVRRLPDAAARARALLQSDNVAGAFTRATLGRTLLYAATIVDDIAFSVDDVDRAMRWGFGWELGPFELWDAIGPDVVLAAGGGADAMPALVRERRASGSPTIRASALGPASPDILRFGDPGRRVVSKKPGATLVDLGEGVLGLDLDSKLNTIGGDTLAMIHAGLAEAAANFEALVIGSDADLFSAGANLTVLLIEAQDGHWDEVEAMVRAFQRATTAIAYAPVPVVVAARGLCLGGGCEIAMHADRVQAGAELYVGLVETSVGLIPAAGGSKAIVSRAARRAGLDPADALDRAFDAVACARVSTSAAEARDLGYLREVDGETMNTRRVLADACDVARARARTGFVPRVPGTLVHVGGPDTFARLSLGVHLAERAGRASAHDALVSRKLAWVLSGGDIAAPGLVPEQHLLDLERDAFLGLVGERKTRDRIAHTLKTGKPLRN